MKKPVLVATLSGVTVLIVVGVVCVTLILHKDEGSVITPTTSVNIENIAKEIEEAIPELPTEESQSEALKTALSSLQDSILEGEYMSKYFTVDDILVSPRDGGAFVSVTNCSRIGYEDDTVNVYFVTATGEVQDYEDIVGLSNFLYELENPTGERTYVTSDTVEEIPGYTCINSSVDRASYATFDSEQLRDLFTYDVTDAVRLLTQNSDSLSDTANFLFSVITEFKPEEVVLVNQSPVRLSYERYLIQVSIRDGSAYTDFYEKN